ncbi:5-(carboxyamino)imidazole ribonucleotide synthase [Fructilactobacillus lindneri]|uniref:N5-carboxyaminoimidazole ribonucleotide synthase n=2 Tax=Fructilactobacillus lindneri TaxID=53444 RepID=A0A0R2JVJ8_9LACO|nr:5-(carboxyamino)imidazole ribonucleotide synthase [Fructilactobacillus lindneri]ANZ57901.1 5-(carboxyamino)imidazole ribonucleotide synthase [Fructilactobacillus lindneri]ANZ59170.1 5-(carboxyamino)imidazole ribonucleotide synthase [Fructilactobacillus lindneri]KRN78631.1 phosphoribosylaminoimidazole carboxylase ATPase subunit [Fructilactobacillus lindneri DSM 20690 = JCM 11027]POG98220.1 5-(carboxyamino)imidazole ribonucleotide synthase [Fructilactobacillus lindneri]POH01663.1 5-(carboxyam
MKNNKIIPPATIGIIGGGQLGRMMAEAAKPMGYNVIILDPQPNSPAGQVSDKQIVAEYDDVAALTELAKLCDVLTYEFENVDTDALKQVSDLVSVPQGTKLLEITSDRLLEKEFIQKIGLPVTDFADVATIGNLPQAAAKVGYPAILKTRSGGYDGHGQWNIENEAEMKEVLHKLTGKINVPLILEKKLAFNQEISIMVTRDGNQEIRTWPIAQNTHQDHILKTTEVNNYLPEKLVQAAHEYARMIADALNLNGVLGIEMFVVGDEVYINELAPRPHNSGHYSIEGCNVSQFEGHIRSITGLPIAKIAQLDDSICMINLLGDQMTQARNDLINHPEWHFHDYQKDQIKPKRKMGHITVLGQKNSENLKTWEKAHHEIN